MTYYAQGPYRAEVINQGLSLTKTNKPQFWLQFRVLESLDINPVTYHSYERTIYWVINENTVEFVCDKLQQLGFNRDSFRCLDLNHPGHQSFVGQEIEVYCKIERYQGKDREKWDIALPRGEAPKVDPIDDNGARQLDALFGRKLKDRIKPAAKSSTKPLGMPEQSSPAVVAEISSDCPGNDDIPF